MAKTALYILQQARELVAEKWITGSMAIRPDLQAIQPWTDSACGWCAAGAIIAQEEPDDQYADCYLFESLSFNVQAALIVLAQHVPGWSVGDTPIETILTFNDDQRLVFRMANTHRPQPAPLTILDLFDRAIARLETQA